MCNVFYVWTVGNRGLRTERHDARHIRGLLYVSLNCAINLINEK